MSMRMKTAPLAEMVRPGSAAFAVALAWTVGSAAGLAAADFSADCCADLEERIAELEETAAGKGNRRVSLTVSGQVNHALLAWDDGDEQNAYVVSNSNSSDRIRFNGDAKITGGLRAGYYIELGLGVSSSAGVDQLDDESGKGPFLRQSIWYFESKRLGALSVGLGAPATDDIIGYNLGGTSVAASSDTSLAGSNLLTRDSSAAGGEAGLNSLSSGNTISLRWRRFLPELDTKRADLVRYDSPIIAGFVASAAWGEDDIWDAALRYAVKTSAFRFAAGLGYYENREEESDTLGWPSGGDSEPNGGDTVIREVKGSASVLHEPTGLFASGAFVHREFSGSDLGTRTFACFPSDDAEKIRNLGIACANRPDFDYWWVNAGIRRAFIPLGWTSIHGEFARSEDAITGLNVSVRSADGGDLDYVTSSTMDIWGVGLVQHVDAAAADFYFAYRHFEADVEGIESSGQRRRAPLEDADLFLAGSRIRF